MDYAFLALTVIAKGFPRVFFLLLSITRAKNLTCNRVETESKSKNTLNNKFSSLIPVLKN